MESKDETEHVGSKDMPDRDSNVQAAGSASRINADTLRQSSDLGEGSSRRPPVIASDKTDIVPAAIGRETCPICIMDFEEGDDLRLLPCEGKHRFHQTCVDPWLLELSSSCPICREDFLALENIISRSQHGHGLAQDDDFDQPDHRRSMAYGSSSISPGNRFSRYLRFAKRRHHRRQREGEDEEVGDPTDPYVPTATEDSTHPRGQSPS